MALIGEMRYLTIGSNTYSLPSSGGSGTVTNVAVSNATNGGLTVSGSPVTSSGTITIGHSNVLNSAQTTSAVYPIKIDKNGHISEYGSAVTIPTKTSDLTNDSGYITTYTDENMKWTASTSTNTYYPLQSTSTATTSTANTINGVSFYQYYNTGGGYRRLDLGNSTAYKSTGGAYGTIRLYGAAATYYGDLVPGVLGTTSGDGHISANRTWTLPDKTGTVALTSDIPTVPTITLNSSATTSPSFYAPTGAGTSGQYLKSSGSGAPTWETFPTIPSITLNGSSTTSPSFYAPTGAGTSGYVLTSNGSGAPSWSSAVLTDVNVTSTAVTAATTNYIVGSTTSTTTTGTLSKHASAVMYTTADSGTSGYTQLRLGNTTATTSAGGKEGQIRLYGTGATYYVDIKAGAIASSNKTITLPNATGTVALTSDIPSVPTSASSATTGISIADHSTTTIYGVTSSTTSVTGVQSSTTTASKASGANSTTPSLTFAMDSTDTKQLNITFDSGSASTWSFSDVTVPIKNTSATTVPIKDSSSTTVVTSKTHSVTDSGHTHTLS